HHLTELRLVEPAIEFEPGPRSGKKCRQSERKQPDHVPGDRSLSAEPCGTHGEGCNAYGLKYRALFVPRPAPQLAPDRGDDAGRPSCTAEHAIKKARAGIGCSAARRDRLHRWSHQPMETEE